MGISEIGDGLTDLAGSVSPELAASFGTLITILKAAGVAFIVYTAYLVAKSILNFRNRNSIKRIEKKVDEIDRKLGLILKSKGKKRTQLKRK